MKRILVVDDSETVLEMARDALEKGGFDVVTASDARKADIYICSSEKPDIIILDVMLPMLDGDKKARMLKNNESTREIPVLLLSSKPEGELRRLVAESGADGFIRKPFASSQLVARIEDALAGVRVVSKSTASPV
jgi:DNA-binding response OmpR family regulator